MGKENIERTFAANDVSHISDADEKLYTVPEVAKILGHGPNHVYILIREGKLGCIMTGKRRKKVPESALTEYKERNACPARHCAVTNEVSI